jgi:hypothetical protein
MEFKEVDKRFSIVYNHVKEHTIGDFSDARKTLLRLRRSINRERESNKKSNMDIIVLLSCVCVVLFGIVVYQSYPPQKHDVLTNTTVMGQGTFPCPKTKEKIKEKEHIQIYDEHMITPVPIDMNYMYHNSKCENTYCPINNNRDYFSGQFHSPFGGIVFTGPLVQEHKKKEEIKPEYFAEYWNVFAIYLEVAFIFLYPYIPYLMVFIMVLLCSLLSISISKIEYYYKQTTQ